MPRALLTRKQSLFVQEYLVDLNATQAAIRAGYKANTAAATGYENLQKPQIAKKLAEAKAKRMARVELTADDVLRELRLLVMSDVRDFEVDARGELTLRAGAPDEAWRAVSSVKHKIRTDANGDTTREIEFKLWDKNSALEKVAKHIRFYPPEKVELTGDAGGPVRVAGLDPNALTSAQLLEMATRLARP